MKFLQIDNIYIKVENIEKIDIEIGYSKVIGFDIYETPNGIYAKETHHSYGTTIRYYKVENKKFEELYRKESMPGTLPTKTGDPSIVKYLENRDSKYREEKFATVCVHYKDANSNTLATKELLSQRASYDPTYSELVFDINEHALYEFAHKFVQRQLKTIDLPRQTLLL